MGRACAGGRPAECLQRQYLLPAHRHARLFRSEPRRRRAGGAGLRRHAKSARGPQRRGLSDSDPGVRVDVGARAPSDRLLDRRDRRRDRVRLRAVCRREDGARAAADGVGVPARVPGLSSARGGAGPVAGCGARPVTGAGGTLVRVLRHLRGARRRFRRPLVRVRPPAPAPLLDRTRGGRRGLGRPCRARPAPVPRASQPGRPAGRQSRRSTRLLRESARLSLLAVAHSRMVG